MNPTPKQAPFSSGRGLGSRFFPSVRCTFGYREKLLQWERVEVDQTEGRCLDSTAAKGDFRTMPVAAWAKIYEAFAPKKATHEDDTFALKHVGLPAVSRT